MIFVSRLHKFTCLGNLAFMLEGWLGLDPPPVKRPFGVLGFEFRVWGLELLTRCFYRCAFFFGGGGEGVGFRSFGVGSGLRSLGFKIGF